MLITIIHDEGPLLKALLKLIVISPFLLPIYML